MFGPQFDYLRVSAATAKTIQHPGTILRLFKKESYIKEGTGTVAERKIFRRVEYDEFEKAAIVGFKKIIRKYEVQFNPQY